jgi:putative ABC transport system permease protein
LVEVLKQVIESLKANKLRSFLSSLGVVIGISFVILMGWALAGLDKAFDITLNMIGTDMLYVDKFDWAGGKKWDEIQQRKDINMKQVNEFISKVKLAEIAIPVARYWNTKVKFENKNFEGVIAMGTMSGYGLTPAGEVIEGRFFSGFEDSYGDKVVVLGNKIAQTIFPDGGAVGKTIKINGFKFKVIGVVAKRGVLFIDFIDNQMFMPLQAFFNCFGSYDRSMSIAVKSTTVEDLVNVKYEAIGIMREIRNLKPWQEDDFSINESKSFEKNINMISLYIWGIGIGMTALSFIVGIIGIMNIMFVSVTERTKEIGIRKAIGAKKINIMFQFIIESLVLCFFGALTAFVICFIIIFTGASLIIMINPDFEFIPRYLPADLFLIATLVSFVVGILAGLVPAIRAANLDPVDALRYEN